MKFLPRVLDLLYPPKCIFCGKLLKDAETDVCRKCRFALPDVDGRIKRGSFFESCISVYYYEEFVAESVRRFKFHGMEQYAPAYGRLLAMRLLRERAHFTLLTWVPVGKKRLKTRGYDQTKLLAQAVAKELNVPCVRTLRKVVDTPAQSGIHGAPERAANVLNAFAVVDAKALDAQRVLLIDDVITTGATLTECSRVLRTAGAAAVICATLAATRKEER